MKIGFIGLGGMGRAMATRLLRAGHPLTAWNRTPEKSEALAREGAKVASSPADAAREAEVVLTMLSDDAAVEQVVFGEGGVLAALPKGALHVCSSTISVGLADRLAEAHARAGQGYLSAPVFGRPAAAEAGQLWVVLAGPTATVERVRPALSAFSRGVSVVGERPSAANLVKLSGNFLLAGLIEMFGEAFALVEKGGIARATFLEVFESVFGGSAIISGYAKLVGNESFAPAFPVPLGLKDVRLVLEAADGVRVPMPLANLAKDSLLATIAAGDGELDWSAASRVSLARAGIRRDRG